MEERKSSEEEGVKERKDEKGHNEVKDTGKTRGRAEGREEKENEE